MKTKCLCVITIVFFTLQNNAGAQSNALGKQIYGGAYTAPVVYKEYKVFSEGYKPPERTSYSTTKYQYSSSSSAPVSTGKSSGSSYDKPIPRGKRFAESVGITSFLGYKDGYGNIVLPAIYDEIRDLHPESKFENYLLVELSGKFGVFWAGDKTPTIPLIYDAIIPINYTTMLVKSGGVSGVINITKPGKSTLAIPVIYDDLGTLDGYAIWTKTNNKYGLTNDDNKTILKQEYDEINVFSPQTVVVKKNGKAGLMNYKGNTVLPLAYESISKVTRGVAWIIEKGKWGLISQEGKILTAPQFDTVYQGMDGNIWIDDLAVVKTGGKINYLGINGELLDYSAATATAAAKYVKNNLFEDFSIEGGRYKWYTTASSFVRIAAGSYIVDAEISGDGINIPFPEEFSYKSGDNWELEISLSKIGGSITSDYGFSWGPKKGLNTVKIGKYGAYLPGSGMGHVDFKVKGGTNKIKFKCINYIASFYYNDKLLGSGEMKDQGSGKFWFSIYNSGRVPYTIYYDAVKFTILEK